MKNYITEDPWKIIENGFHPAFNQITESLCSLGNGMIGGRGCFEEEYTGKTLPGNYIAGIFYPDKTRVGWWKNGYPDYFAKVLNNADWTCIKITIGEHNLDLHKSKILSFKRELDMEKSILSRQVKFEFLGSTFEIEAERFCSINRLDTSWLRYSIKSVDYEGHMRIESAVDFDVRNQDSNYDEDFWEYHCQHIDKSWGHVFCKTKKTNFKVCIGLKSKAYLNENIIESAPVDHHRYVAHCYEIDIAPGDSVQLTKTCAFITEYHHGDVKLTELCSNTLQLSEQIGYEAAKANHIGKWKDKWRDSDIEIDGDVAAQQGIRFNIFHLNQSYNGTDERLNIGPKGFTGEKYGGSTYWDTEAYCLPFFLSTAEPPVAKNLLVYRHRHLKKAIENASKLGFDKGAALYPMVTMTGEECHNEWEITFEEIHRNGAIAYAIYDYIRYNDDKSYLSDYGLEVLIAISRFWAQRVNWSTQKNAFVILGVTGPNEYENNVNNNWYTNYIARWCLKYTITCISDVKKSFPNKYSELVTKWAFDENEELNIWSNIIDKMYFPFDEERKLFLQQDGFLDKELIAVSDLEKSDRPLNQHWSWDRILRSCFIKQADILQGFYFFEDDFTLEELEKHFSFYEPLTVHESSLSPCVHSILASKLGMTKKAYEMYLRTSRLDIDDVNNDTEDGLHITSMAGTWMTITKGFAGMRIINNQLSLEPYCPAQWNSYTFTIQFRGASLSFKMTEHNIHITNNSSTAITILLNSKEIFIDQQSKNSYPLN